MAVEEEIIQDLKELQNVILKLELQQVLPRTFIFSFLLEQGYSTYDLNHEFKYIDFGCINIQ